MDSDLVERGEITLDTLERQGSFPQFKNWEERS